MNALTTDTLVLLAALALVLVLLVLLLVRLAQATWQVIQGRRDSMIASHQGEDAHIQQAAADGAHKA